ncbi:hypothetical protein ACQP2U_03075 [Nocardia sp. CA-084685]|uniref:hypothetical protein n=1 Tax=Nocardia sp. CA-084685 TaxID=3239970 RepID=UPI003D96D687
MSNRLLRPAEKAGAPSAQGLLAGQTISGPDSESADDPAANLDTGGIAADGAPR